MADEPKQYRKGQFRKGVSGNPGGRRKTVVEVAEAARKRTLKAIETLEEVMLDRTATGAARVAAAVALLERGWGKAPASVTIQRRADLETLTDEELLAIAAGGEPDDGSDPTPEDYGKPH